MLIGRPRESATVGGSLPCLEGVSCTHGTPRTTPPFPTPETDVTQNRNHWFGLRATTSSSPGRFPISATRAGREASRFSGDVPLVFQSTPPPRIGEGRVNAQGLFQAGGGLLHVAGGSRQAWLNDTQHLHTSCWYAGRGRREEPTQLACTVQPPAKEGESGSQVPPAFPNWCA